MAPHLAPSRDRIAQLPKELGEVKPAQAAVMRELPQQQRRQTNLLIKGNFLVKGDPTTGTKENLNLLLGIVGGKINIGRGLLVNTGVLFPLTDSGLQPKITAYLGFDYVF